MTDKFERLASALTRWQQDDPEGHNTFVRKMGGGHGAPVPPPPEAMLTDDPELYLATAELHETCSGECEGLCEC